MAAPHLLPSNVSNEVHYTDRHAQIMAYKTLGIWGICYIADLYSTIAGANGAFTTMVKPTDRGTSMTFLGASIITGLVIDLIIDGDLFLRASAYHKSSKKMRSDKTQGLFAEDAVDDAVNRQVNNWSNIAAWAAIALGFLTNAVWMAIPLWPAITGKNPLFVFGSITATLLVAIAVTYGAHKGQFSGFNFLDMAKMARVRTNIAYHSAVQQLRAGQPKP